jgi:hypothetical protein
MSLALINERLRNYYYSNALEFATDVRRIVTETYRAASDPIEEDFKAQKARLLQKEFEFQFSRVKDDEESETGGMNKATIMKDPFICKLIKAQELLASINNGVSTLTSDVVAFMDSRRERKIQRRIKRQNSSVINNHSAIDRKSTISPPKKRQRTSPSKNKTLTGVKPIVSEPVPNASPEQIGEWIQNLDAGGQEHLLEILKRNNEEIEVDDEGEVELSLENWSNKTLVDVEVYLRHKLNEPTISTQSMRNTVQSIPERQGVPDHISERNQTSIPEYHHPSHVNNTYTTAHKPKEPIHQKSSGTKGGKDRLKSKSKKSKHGMASSSDSSDGSDESSSDEN